MKYSNKLRHKKSEQGVALLIALFVLLLVSAVAMALVAGAGSETMLASNYRNSSNAFYAAAAGIEEGRGRLVASNPNALPALMVPTPFALGNATYIVNPAPGEAAGSILATYPDTEYATEFSGTGFAIPAVQTTNSMYTAAANPGPLYKWVRINAVTEAALQVNVGNHALPLDAAQPLYYDGAHLTTNQASPNKQALEVTALAVLPNGGRKILQYVVAPVSYNLNFPGALTVAGQIGGFAGANSNPYQISGVDGAGAPPAVAGCVNNAPAVSGIAVSPGNSTSGLTNVQQVINGLPRPAAYTGSGGTPSVSAVATTGSLATPASLNTIIQSIQQNADAVIPNPPNPPNFNNSATTYSFGGPGWPPSVTATNPGIVYVDGSFNLGPNTGSGILVVTGNFTYSGNSGWNGIILVVGAGTTTFLGNGGGSGSFNGAVFTATTRDASGAQLANFGTANFDISGGGGNGIYYNSCWINKVQQPPSYSVLSFRERSL